MAAIVKMPILRRPILSLALLAVLLAALALFAVWLAPWYRAGTTPLQVRMALPADVEATVSWDADDTATRLPLVQVEPGVWATELPPRPDYTVTLHLDRPLGALPVADVLLRQLDIPRADLWRGTLRDLHPMPDDPTAFRLTPLIERNEALGFGRASWLIMLSVLTLAIIGVASIVAILRIDPRLGREPRTLARFPMPLAILCLASAALACAILFTAEFELWPADSLAYGQRAYLLINQGTLDTGASKYELSRLPGASIFEAAAFKVLGNDLQHLFQAQVFCYLLAALWVIWVLARRYPGWIWYIAAPLVILSPYQMVFHRILCSESPFTFAALPAIGCLVLMMDGRRVWLWACAGGLFAGFAIVTRINGLVLLTPALLYILAALRLWVRERDFRALLRNTLPWAACIALALAPITAWTIRNAIVLDYPKPMDMAALTRLVEMTKSGMMDVRIFEDPAYYDEVITKRYQSQYAMEGWGMSGTVAARTDFTGMDRGTAMKAFDAGMNALADKNDARIPFPARIATYVRAMTWVAWFDRDPNFQPYGNASFKINNISEKHRAYMETLVKGWLHPSLTYRATHTNRLHHYWNKATRDYHWPMRALVLVGLLGYLWSAWSARPGPTALLMVYWAAPVLAVVLRVALLRYAEPVMPILFLGVACAATQAPLVQDAPARIGRQIRRLLPARETAPPQS